MTTITRQTTKVSLLQIVSVLPNCQMDAWICYSNFYYCLLATHTRYIHALLSSVYKVVLPLVRSPSWYEWKRQWQYALVWLVISQFVHACELQNSQSSCSIMLPQLELELYLNNRPSLSASALNFNTVLERVKCNSWRMHCVSMKMTKSRSKVRRRRHGIEHAVCKYACMQWWLLVFGWRKWMFLTESRK